MEFSLEANGILLDIASAAHTLRHTGVAIEPSAVVLQLEIEPRLSLKLEGNLFISFFALKDKSLKVLLSTKDGVAVLGEGLGYQPEDNEFNALTIAFTLLVFAKEFPDLVSEGVRRDVIAPALAFVLGTGWTSEQASAMAEGMQRILAQAN